ncbi:MAG: cupin domain-containing protein [Candidatus Korarchaeum sp.]
MFRMRRGEEARVLETWPGVRRKTLALGERMVLLEVSMEAGSVGRAHSHPNEQVGYVVRGRLRLRIGSEVHELGPGDAYVIPSGVEHEATALEETRVVEVFSPPHEVFKRDLEEG